MSGVFGAEGLGFVALGIGAGLLTTVTGQGGGLLLLLACSAIVGPHRALALTTPALLLGNAHRAYLHRRAIVVPVAARMIAGAVPGALVGGLVAHRLSPMVLDVVLVVLTLVALAKAAKLLRFAVPRATLAPAAFMVGLLTGAAGGAGILFSPLLLAIPVTGAAFIGTSSIVAVATHAGRMVGYGATGLFDGGTLAATALVAVAIFVGNALGQRVRALMSDRTSVRLEYATLVVCVVLAVAGG